MLRAHTTSKPIAVCPFGLVLHKSLLERGLDHLPKSGQGEDFYSLLSIKPTSWIVVRPVRIRQISIKSRRATAMIAFFFSALLVPVSAVYHFWIGLYWGWNLTRRQAISTSSTRIRGLPTLVIEPRRCLERSPVESSLGHSPPKQPTLRVFAKRCQSKTSRSSWVRLSAPKPLGRGPWRL